MQLAITTRLLPIVRNQDAPSFDVAAEPPEGPVTPEEYGLAEWWPYQSRRSLGEDPNFADGLWPPFGGLIGP
jgi:hypothetical protein